MVAATPLYLDLAMQLRAEIEAGVYPPGSQLPSESELCATHGVSRTTVRQAIAQLVTDGAIRTQGGIRHRVADQERIVWHANRPKDSLPGRSWKAQFRDEGHESSETIRTEVLVAPSPIKELLRLPDGDGAIVARRYRVRFIDGHPYSIADSYYPRSIVAGTEIEIPRDIAAGVFSVFEQLGRAWVYATEDMVARPPTRDESETLRIGKGVPVAERLLVWHDGDDAPVCVARYVYPGDRQVVRYHHPLKEVWH